MNVSMEFSDSYYTPSRTSAFGGKQNFLKAHSKRKRDEAEIWLRAQDAYTLHKPVKTKFKRRPTLVAGPGEQLQADLMDVSSHSMANDGVKFLLTVIDVFSKKAWAIPIKRKTGEAVSEALKGLFERVQGYQLLQTDKGKEFYNSRVKDVLKEEGIRLFSTENETMKATIVERFNRTLRNKIHRVITKNQNERYLDSLKDLVSAYNETKHRSTGRAPNDVNRSNAGDVWFYQYERDGKNAATREPTFSEGQFVRISGKRMTFERGYTANWTEEVFKVKGVDATTRPPSYTIEDLSGEVVEGTFYGEELQRVEEPEIFKVERVLERRGRRGNRMVLVKWKGYPESFNSWIPESNIV